MGIGQTHASVPTLLEWSSPEPEDLWAAYVSESGGSKQLKPPARDGSRLALIAGWSRLDNFGSSFEFQRGNWHRETFLHRRIIFGKTAQQAGILKRQAIGVFEID